tara:strand:+ start:7489 stop:7836 length:348 start_codon:yes stop_codon:yes gene_type:complete
MRAPILALAAITLVASSCVSASVDFERTTKTSGTFRSTGSSWTFFGWDQPKAAMQIARENAFDAGLSNLRVVDAYESPDWGWWSWMLEIVSRRTATVEGTWGWSGEALRNGEIER